MKNMLKKINIEKTVQFALFTMFLFFLNATFVVEPIYQPEWMTFVMYAFLVRVCYCLFVFFICYFIRNKLREMDLFKDFI